MKPVRTVLVNSFGDYLLAVGESGGFVDVPTAARFAGVSRNRMVQLLEAGTLRRYSVNGRYAVGFTPLMRWATGIRRAGCRAAQAALGGAGVGTAIKTAVVASQGPGTGLPAPGGGAGRGASYAVVTRPCVGLKNKPAVPPGRKGASK